MTTRDVLQEFIASVCSRGHFRLRIERLHIDRDFRHECGVEQGPKSIGMSSLNHQCLHIGTCAGNSAPRGTVEKGRSSRPTKIGGEGRPRFPVLPARNLTASPTTPISKGVCCGKMVSDRNFLGIASERACRPINPRRGPPGRMPELRGILGPAKRRGPRCSVRLGDHSLLQDAPRACLPVGGQWFGGPPTTHPPSHTWWNVWVGGNPFRGASPQHTHLPPTLGKRSSSTMRQPTDLPPTAASMVSSTS